MQKIYIIYKKNEIKEISELENIKQQPVKFIKCPHCGWNYLPGEVLYPINMIGYPTNIIRDGIGNIIYHEYPENKEPLAEEQYWCDNCEKPFIIDIDINYKTHVEKEELDFSNTAVKLF